MKYVLALILSLLFTVTAYASPEIYSNGMYKEKIIYLGTMNKGTESGYYIYSTQESLEANYNKTNYHNYNIWILDILLAPAQEEIRVKWIDMIKKSKNINWVNTKSGSKKFWAINYETVYWNRLRKKINDVRNYVPVNVINAGIGGITAKESLKRMEGQVFAHNPGE